MKLFFVAVLVGTSFFAQAASPAAQLPSDFADGLALIPADVESFSAISRPFEMPRFLGRYDLFFKRPLTPSSYPLDEFAQTMISFALTSDADATVFEGVVGAKVNWAVFAKRQQDKTNLIGMGVTGGVPLGLHPFEAVSVVRFQAPLPSKFVDTISTTWSLTSDLRCSFWQSPSGSRYLMMSDRTLISVKVLRASKKMLHDICALVKGEGVSFSLNSVESAENTLDFSADIWSAKKDLLIKTRNEAAPTLSGVGVDNTWVLSSYDASTTTLVSRQYLPHGMAVYDGLRSVFHRPSEIDTTEFHYQSVIHVVGDYLKNTIRPWKTGDFSGLRVFFVLQMMGIPIIL